MVKVQTFHWRWDYSKDEWEASLFAPGRDEFRLRRDNGNNVVIAEHGGEAWLLRVRGSEVLVHRKAEFQPLATRRLREIRFSDDTIVDVDSGGWHGLTLTEQIRFTNGTDTLVTMRELFWARSGRRVRVTTTAAGTAFPGRALLVLLGFHDMVDRDRHL